MPEIGLATKIEPLRGRSEIPDEERRGGGSDDIGDISWVVPTVTLNYPANMQAGPGHNWANAISMATPIAHKGIYYGSKVVALTVLDFLTRPELVTQAWDYFNNVQTKNTKYVSFIRPGDKPAIWLNEQIMAKYRPEMKKYYYDPSKYKTYLEQLGITYPTVRDDAEVAEAGLIKHKGHNGHKGRTFILSLVSLVSFVLNTRRYERKALNDRTARRSAAHPPARARSSARRTRRPGVPDAAVRQSPHSSRMMQDPGERERAHLDVTRTRLPSRAPSRLETRRRPPGAGTAPAAASSASPPDTERRSDTCPSAILRPAG